MKRIHSLIIIACLLAAGLASADPGEGELFLNYTYQVKPGRSGEFEKVLKKWKASFAKRKPPQMMHVYSDKKSRYEILVPIETYAEIDGLNELFERREMKDCESVRVGVLRRVPELSYQPKKPRLESRDAQAYAADFLHVQPDKIERFMQIYRRLVQLAEEKQASEGWDFYRGVIGYDGPLFIGIVRGKDQADLKKHNNKMWRLFGKEGRRLNKESKTVGRRRESREGRHRPELSIPEYR